MKFGLIGKNIGYSLSPLIYDYFFKKNDLDNVYSLIDINYFDKSTIQELINSGYVGLNFTQPFKQDIFNLGLDIDYSNIALRTRSVNNLYVKSKTDICAHNTDYEALDKSFDYYKIELQNKNVLILGAGATAKSLIEILLSRKANVIIYNRSKSKIVNLDNVEYYENCSSNINIIINATSVSFMQLSKDDKLRNFLLNYLDVRVLYDINYRFNNEEFLLNFAKSKDVKVIDGLFMLMYQAKLNAKIWLNQDFDITEDLKKLLRKNIIITN